MASCKDEEEGAEKQPEGENNSQGGVSQSSTEH